MFLCLKNLLSASTSRKSGHTGLYLTETRLANLFRNYLSIIDAAAEEALLSRAYAEAGNNSDEYEDLVRYFDLVDSYNGNAWVGTADGVTVKVYVPYSALSEAVDPDTIEVYHFEGLHRDGTNDGKIDVASAAGWGQVEEIKIEKAENGFYIETESFSPFIIMWKLNDNGEDNTPGDNTGDNAHVR